MRIRVRSYLTSSISLGRTGNLENELCCQSSVRDAELGHGLFRLSHQHTQLEVRGQRSVDNLVCRDQPSEHRQDRQKPRKGIASPGNKLMWKTVYKDGHNKFLLSSHRCSFAIWRCHSAQEGWSLCPYLWIQAGVWLALTDGMWWKGGSVMRPCNYSSYSLKTPADT